MILPVLDDWSSQKKVAVFLVLIAVVFNATYLRTEVTIPAFYHNDGVLHYTAIEQTSIAIQERLDPTDYWLVQIGLGFPLFHYYQHLPYVLIAELNQITRSVLPLSGLIDVSRYLLLVYSPFQCSWQCAGLSSITCQPVYRR
jgi:hypothetical protein